MLVRAVVESLISSHSSVMFFIISAKFINWIHFLDNDHMRKFGETKIEEIRHLKETYNDEVFKKTML